MWRPYPPEMSVSGAVSGEGDTWCPGGGAPAREAPTLEGEDRFLPAQLPANLEVAHRGN